ncbi:hypothetical protein [Evansella cellulosilytica]|uniref:Uncharacterized protein n=1 Tax=Evansella cellulosilytica (strain ATCC 21833 / DSM 2522 / FERM P-1141 / JCM 9156 / N-4) TaxID=649639 RepID=E6TUF2_EVAC2|nr:hypothetical protein [Evansella cellulosilytica]ADU29708.1 hypothetical protein Bcell_1445 [Evansella cellulosilytica DSM 2522]
MSSKESKYEGRDKVMVDVDRMTNEGLAGGKDHITHGKRQIDEAQNFKEEEPPYNVANNDK